MAQLYGSILCALTLEHCGEPLYGNITTAEERLHELKTLRENNLTTDEEYEAKRRAILNEL